MTRRRDESELLDKILLNFGNGNVRLFRNNVGALQDKRGQWVRYGVCNPGGSDLIGWTRVTITPEMVGKDVAVFTAIEVKAGTKPTQEQLQFLGAVESHCGKAGVARSLEDAASIIASGTAGKA